MMKPRDVPTASQLPSDPTAVVRGTPRSELTCPPRGIGVEIAHKDGEDAGKGGQERSKARRGVGSARGKHIADIQSGSRGRGREVGSQTRRHADWTREPLNAWVCACMSESMHAFVWGTSCQCIGMTFSVNASDLARRSDACKRPSCVAAISNDPDPLLQCASAMTRFSAE